MKTQTAPDGIGVQLRALAARFASAHGRRLWLWLLVCTPGWTLVGRSYAQAPQGPPNPALFSRADFLDAPRLIQEIRTQSDAVSALVWSRFPAAAQLTLADVGAPLPDQLSALVEGLNSVLQGDALHDQPCFGGVGLSPQTRALVAQAPQGDERVRLNRLLLEDAYRLELRRGPPPVPVLPTGTSVSTDQLDYAPGTTAHIRGRGFQAGETVQLQVLHADGTPDEGADHAPWSVVADASGAFQATWHVCEDDCLGATLRLTAAGQASGRTAQALFTDAVGAPTYQQLQSFGVPSGGSSPEGRLLQGADGALYGTANQGGGSGYGTVFKLNPDGTGFTVLVTFDYSATGGNPYAGLMQAADGALYGTAASGGSSGYGTVFKLMPDGTGFTVLLSLDDSTTGGTPIGGLMQGADGALYGTAVNGGSGGYGTVFKLNPDGTGFTVLQNFDYSTTGANPESALIQGTDGALYGTAYYGGSNGGGTVFKLNPDGTGFTVLRDFGVNSTTGGNPIAALLQGADGALYGTASQGGSVSGGAGTLFKLNPDGTGFTVLQTFVYSISGAFPYGTLIQGTDGALYGTTRFGSGDGFGAVFTLNPDGTGYAVLQAFSFSGSGDLFAGVMQGADGALYGAAAQGGGGGALFTLNPDGTGYTVLKNLSQGPDISASGGFPNAGVTQATDGALYGTTQSGGSNRYGTVYRLDSDGTNFSAVQNLAYFTTGAYVSSSLLQGTDGALYGTAQAGGSGGYGTVFKLNPDGTGFAAVHDFDYTTGAYPYAALIQGTDGALYGTASWGGSTGYGTVFKLNSDGTGFSVLKDDFVPASGAYPYAGLLQGTDGALYGTASVGGSGGYGAVFKLNPDGTGFSVLKDDFGYSTTGGLLYAGLMQGADGALYGEAYYGGSGGYGTVFKLNSDGTGFSVLQNLDHFTTGSNLFVGHLIQGTDGLLYGTAQTGGSGGYGTVFQLKPDGTDFSVLLNFDHFTTGSYPLNELMQGADGNLYGTTNSGASGAGTVFRLVFDASSNQPPVARCKDVTVSAGEDCSATASIDDGSFDPDVGDTITLAQTPAGPYPLGPTAVTLTVTDSHGASSTCTSTVTVLDTTPPVIACPADVSVGCGLERLASASYPAPTVFDTCDPAPTVTCTPPSGSASFAVGTTTVACTAVDSSGNESSCSFVVTRAALGFTGFLSPINGEVARGTGGSFADPLKAFKFGSTVPVKFRADCGGSPIGVGVHTLQATKYSSSVDADIAIDATPSDEATTGNQFRLTSAASGEWHFNLNTKPLSIGTWKLTATLSDGTTHAVWITIKR